MNGSRKLQRLMLPIALLPGMALAGEVSLSGEGSVRYQPDSARLQFTASAEDAIPQKATEEVNDLMRQWRAAIEGYQDKLQDYTDANVQLYSRTLPSPDRESEPEKRAVASQTVTFSINDLTLLNPILEQAQAIGLDYYLNGSQFFHSDESGLEREALARAIADARSRCEFVANELNQTCGDVVSINVNGGFRPRPMMMAESKGATDAVSSVGVREINATVNATFELD
ncbi:MAG: DUF541 domain-containing protein [Gammaproteobacteria bacterium]|uniref:SIMPL domain-containing protein n=1 Tax=Marinobacter nitratireducens TaxID=1137280 RepID=A0A072N638_9GAMM|nr:SIMPL domain-containing protein [Marinobacter nitratireducens]KEF32981.1 Hypothetical protein D777_00543 [Marinobacter nitratireducens]TNE71167.1 MAG: DUF541 domain-containing protein [Gammaproteobacteria bacterium]